MDKKAWVAETATKIKAAGFRVFLAESGTYGFFTDETGERVVSFQLDLLQTTFSGNYKTDRPASTGTGWRISDQDTGDYRGMFAEYPPRWAVGDAKWKFTTLDQHLSMYQSSSHYREV